MNDETLPAIIQQYEGVELPRGAALFLDDHFASIRRKVVREADTIAKNDQRESVEPRDVSAALQRYAPGILFPDEPSWSDRILSSISGITLISALLATIFGLIGVFSGSPIYNDIVKLLAGAILGSTGAGAIATRRRKPV